MTALAPRRLDYQLHRHTLDNGLRLVINPDPWAPVVAVNLWYDVGSAHEVMGRTGFAHLFEHLMFAGSAQTGAGEHQAALEALGAEVNATTSFDRTNYFETVPAGATALALWYESARLESLLEAIDQPTLDTERQVVKEEKRLRYDNVPYGDAFAQVVELVFGADHPYGHMPIGSMADLDAATVADVHAFFRQYYQPKGAVLTLAGAIQPETAIELAEQYFGHLGNREPVPEDGGPACPDLIRAARVHTDGRPGPSPGTATRLPSDLVIEPLPPMTGHPRLDLQREVPLDAIYLAWRVPPFGQVGHQALGLALSILGDGLTGRLYQALARTGLADAVGAYDLELNRGNSLALISATARPGVALDQLEEVAGQVLAQFIAEGPTAEEIQRATARATRDLLSDLCRIGERADCFAEATMVFDNPDRVNTWPGELAAISAAEIQAAAANWLAPQAYARVSFSQEVA